MVARFFRPRGSGEQGARRTSVPQHFLQSIAIRLEVTLTMSMNGQSDLEVLLLDLVIMVS